MLARVNNLREREKKKIFAREGCKKNWRKKKGKIRDPAPDLGKKK
jgi:hypothetical protein